MIIKLRNRLLVTIMAFISIIMLTAFASIYMITYFRISSENMEKVNSAEVITVSEDGQIMWQDQMVSGTVVVSRISPSLGVYFNLITDASGNPVWIDSALDLNMEDYKSAAAIAVGNPEGGVAMIGDREWQYVTITSDQLLLNFDNSTASHDLQFIRFLDITEPYKMLENLLFTLIFLYAVLLIVFFLIARYFAARSVQPMAAAWESQRQFIADVSHELKTPISTLKMNLDILYASSEQPIKQQVKWLNNSKSVLKRMTTLIQSMLELARIDEMSSSYRTDEVDVGPLLDEVTDSYTPLISKKRILISENIHLAAPIHSNYSMIQQIVEILMDNAIKYTNEGGEIHVSAHSEKDNTFIKIQNTGDGISPTDINKVFDRFYRGDKSRVYKEDSYGLGLSIAKSIVEKLGGEIHAQSDRDWTCFTVRIPGKSSR